MKVKVENTGPCRKTLNVELPVETVAAEYEKVLAKFAGKSSIPGYRKGKAPALLVERRHNKAIMEEVKDNLVYDSYRAALGETKIDPVAVLEVADIAIEKSAPMSCKIVIEVPPEFKLPDYRRITVKPGKVEVSDEQVQQQFDNLLESMAEYEDVRDRPSRKGDLVKIDYEGFHEGKPIGGPNDGSAGLARGRGFWVALDESAFLPDMAEKLEGMKPGECREMETTFPPDFKPQFMAGKTATYRVNLNAVREKKLPPVDEEFLKRLQADSEDALRRRLREALVAEAERREKDRLKNEIVEKLLKSTALEVPESMVRNETRNAFSALAAGMARRGASRKQLNEHKDSMLDSASKTAGDRVKLGFILTRIAEKENIAVDESEVESAVRGIAARAGSAPETTRKELEERNQIASIRDEILWNKTLDFLLENANAEEKDGILGRLLGRKEA